ncbi:MAG: GNAT family N-acetyltransferase [Endomicrobium sp.]|jgi:RimJ/RimL family protein N-acetyltransferase|nr:GNAT family N-acetyltransferase [Endomicrobium sp.]
MQIIEVQNQEQIKTVVSLADEIWNEYYSKLLSQAQIDYMLENFQSLSAVNRQIKDENYHYFLLKADNGSFEGFFAIVPQPQEKNLFLSKIYIRKESRAKGYGKQSVSFIKDFAKSAKLQSITLTVNRENTDSIKSFKKIGFKIVETIDALIGHGFVMNDYRMRLEI